MTPTKIEAEPEAWRRVAAAVVARRTQLGMTQEELAAAAIVSPTTIRYVETAARSAYRALTMARVAAALDWPASRFIEILAGEPGDETEDDGYGQEVGDDWRDERIASLEAAVEALTVKVDALYDRLIGKARAVPPRRPRSKN